MFLNIYGYQSKVAWGAEPLLGHDEPSLRDLFPSIIKSEPNFDIIFLTKLHILPNFDSSVIRSYVIRLMSAKCLSWDRLNFYKNQTNSMPSVNPALEVQISIQRLLKPMFYPQNGEHATGLNRLLQKSTNFSPSNRPEDSLV